MTYLFKLSRRLHAGAAVLLVLAGILACADSFSPDGRLDQHLRVQIFPPDTTIYRSEQISFRAFGYPRGPDSTAITPEWQVLGEGRIDAAGRYAPGGAGVGRVVATHPVYREMQDTVTVSVLEEYAVDLAEDTVALLVGEQRQLQAVVRDGGGDTVSGDSLVWTSDDPEVASVTGGTVVGLDGGMTWVRAEKPGNGHGWGRGGRKAADSTRVTVSEPGVASVEITPDPMTLTVGDRQQATASVMDPDGAAVPGAVVVWSALDPAVATVDTAGEVEARAPGTARVVAASDGVADTAVVFVGEGPVASVTVTPASAGLTVGGSVQLTAQPRDVSGAPLSDRPVAWASSDATVATVDSSGLVWAVASGTAAVSATSEGQTGTATITVALVPIDTLVVVPATLTLSVGDTAVLAVELRDAAGNSLTGRVVTFASALPEVAAVDAAGSVAAMGGGSTVITVSAEGRTTSVPVTVAAPVASVTVAPDVASVLVNGTVQLGATARDALGNVLTGVSVAWSSSADAVASVSGTGLVTGLAAGTAVVTASANGVPATATVTVSDPPAPPPGLVFSSDWSTGTGRSDYVLRDGGKWDTYSSPHDLLEVISAPAGFPGWMTNVLQVEYNNENARMLVAEAGRWTAPEIGQHLFYRVFMRHSLADGNGWQGAGSHHPSQSYTHANGGFIWLWKFGNENNGTYPVLLALPGASAPRNNYDLVPMLDKDTVYMFEWRVFRESATVMRLSVRISDAAGTLLYDDDDFLDGAQWATLAQSNPALAYTSTEQMTSWELGNNGPLGWTATAGTIQWGGIAIAISNDPAAWIGAN